MTLTASRSRKSKVALCWRLKLRTTGWKRWCQTSSPEGENITQKSLWGPGFMLAGAAAFHLYRSWPHPSLHLFRLSRRRQLLLCLDESNVTAAASMFLKPVNKLEARMTRRRSMEGGASAMRDKRPAPPWFSPCCVCKSDRPHALLENKCEA